MRSLKVDAVHLSYVEKGSGDPILFIPGLISQAAQWSHQVDYFAKTTEPSRLTIVA
jgi:pimeloyl-ACP methyl ester carboxylesterase